MPLLSLPIPTLSRPRSFAACLLTRLPAAAALLAAASCAQLPAAAPGANASRPAAQAVPAVQQSAAQATPAAAAAPTGPTGQASRQAGSVGTDARERTLSNGLKVIVKEDRRAPTVAHMVWYRAGSIDEVNGKTGVAHVLEHMMFKGTANYGPGEFSRRVAAAGGRENAFTSRDYTGYYQQIHKSKLAEVMALEADRMGNLVLSKDEFDKEIRVVMEERRWRTEDRAQSLVYEQLMATTFIASPYRAPIVGWMSDLQAMTFEDARDWYQGWYAPNNAVAVIAGDVDAEEVFRLAEATYGKMRTRPLPPRKPQGEPAQRGAKRIQVKAPAENPYVVIAFHVPGLTDVERDREPYAIEVLSAVLDGHESARYTRNVVRGARVANAAGASYDMIQRGPALFMLDGTPAQGKSAADVERALRAEIARIARDGVSAEELERVKAQYVAGQIYKRDSIFAQAMEFASLEVTGFSYRDADRILERIRAVSPQEVQQVARRYFGEDTMTVAELLPQPVADKPAAPPAGLRH